MESLPLIPFETINLYKHLGSHKFGNLKTNKDFEKMFLELFGLAHPENCDNNRGDLVKITFNDDNSVNKEFWDHKNCNVLSKNRGHNDYFISVKYSNVYAKIWIQMAMRELDEIMKHIEEDYRIKLLRYKTELNWGDLKYIDSKMICYRKTIYDTNSYCFKYNIGYYDFCDHLCRYNVRKFGNLLLVHDCPSYDHENIRFKMTDNDLYTELPKGEQYLLTPINTKESLIYLDYIGYAGFRIAVNKFKQKKDITFPPEMKPLIDELDMVTKLIDYQNSINGENSSSNFLKKCGMIKNYNKRDKWDFREFEQENHLSR